jgi:oligopeptide/dipeptide ABC transporter ATP-binding protein
MDCAMPLIPEVEQYKPHSELSMEPILDVTDLRTRFHIPEGTVYAVNGISFHVLDSETLAVVGESGCGKSVSMLSVMGLIPIPPGEIVSGTALYMGHDLLRKSETEMEHIRGKDIAMIFQDPMTALNPVLTIGRQLTEALRTHLGMTQSEANQRAIDLLDRVGIPLAKDHLLDYPHQFSGGMRQRVMIAMALSCNPNLLIADEPTTALDVTIQAQIVELMIHLREQFGMSIIWITHDLGVVAGIADRVVVMYAGFIVEEASVDVLYDNPLHPYTHALMGALPRVDRRRDHRLKSIPGAPPSLLVEPRGCPFAPRCEFAFDRCLIENPQLITVGLGHKIACWIDVQTGNPR